MQVKFVDGKPVIKPSVNEMRKMGDVMLLLRSLAMHHPLVKEYAEAHKAIEVAFEMLGGSLDEQ